MRARTNLLMLAVLLVAFSVATALAAGPQPPPGWGKPKPLPPANGAGQVSFKQGGQAFSLPLQKVEISKQKEDLIMVSLEYVDAKQENRLELYFSSMPKLGKNDPRMITGFSVTTKAQGLSRLAANRGKCTLALEKLTDTAVSGGVACTGMADMSAQKSAPEVTEVKFTATRN